MPLIIDNIPFISRKRQSASGSTGTLTLIAATYEEGQWVRLRFDKDIDISGIVMDLFTVGDSPTGLKYTGSAPATLVAPNEVQVELVSFEDYIDPGVVLWVDAGGGIVGIDGSTWAGVVGLELPWP